MRDRAHSPAKLFLIAFSCLSLSLLLSSFATPRADAQRRRARPRPAATPARQEFAHNRREHQLACDKCHQFPSPDWKEARKPDAFPDVTRQPEHASCLNCHRTQFFARERPRPRICSVCHVAATPRNQARLPFPNPPETFDKTERARDFESDFRIGFPHDKHLELVGGLTAPAHETGRVRFVTASFRPALKRQDSDPKSCMVCHQTYQRQGKGETEYATEPPKDLGERFWLKKGTFKTAPNHATCFTCHSQDSGVAPAPNDCNACHKLAGATFRTADFDAKLAASMNVSDGTIMRRWRTRYSSGTYPHEGGGHADLACTTCHDAAKMNMLDPKSARVPLESCAACHVTATTDDGGALNAEADKKKADAAFQCTKCHVVYGREPLPDSHAKALAVAK
ncbi:MAG TPA: multiheme c-type cytochrome [Pyrinomonadaceae bacterium]